MIELKNVSKKYNERLVLNKINLKFRKNEFVCILGPSGSGKTTLLNIIGLLDDVSNGEVLFGGTNIQNINKEFYHNKIVSFIFQNYNLIDNLNIYDNLVLPLKLTNKKIDKFQIINYLNDFGLKKDLNCSVKNLSGGERQRLAIIRSLITDSKIILADEPTGALDSVNGEKVMRLLEKISKDKLVVVVTHNKELAEKYATRIIRIEDGTIINDTNSYIDEIKCIDKPVKTKLGLFEKIKLSWINLKSKRFRNILTIIAFSVGLFSLSLVLSISNGFNRELTNLQKESLFNYPIIINKSMYKEKNSIIDNNNYDNKKININDNYELVSNKFDEEFFTKVNKIVNDGLAYKAVYKKMPDDFKIVSFINPTNNYFKVIMGRYSQNNNEILLLVDQNNSINKVVQDYLKIDNLDYSNILNRKIKVNKNEFIIVGIVKSNNEYFASLNGFLINEDAFDGDIESVYLYSTSYKNKDKIVNILKDYNIEDNAKDVLDITKSLINGVSLVLIIFSVISLLVSAIMICVMCYISIYERKCEIGILESMGISRSDLKSLFITENQLIGIISSIIGIIFSYLVGLILNSYINKITSFTSVVLINYKTMITVLEISIFLIEVACFFPLNKIKRKNIIDNIQDR